MVYSKILESSANTAVESLKSDVRYCFSPSRRVKRVKTKSHVVTGLQSVRLDVVPRLGL